MLELLSEEFDGECVIFKIHSRTLRDSLRIRSQQLLDNYLVTIRQLLDIQVTSNGNVYTIEAPILLKLKNRDAKKARKERGQVAPREEKDKEKDKENNSGRVFVDPLRVIECYNETLSQIKGHFRGIALPPKALTVFRTASGFLTTLEDWKNLFEIVRDTEFLAQSNWCKLLWLIDYDNASKVLNGTYGEQTEEVSPYPFSDEMAQEFRDDLKTRLLEGLND